MWTRDLLKTNARVALRERYWTAVLVSVVVTFLTGGSSGFGGFSFGNRFSTGSGSNDGVQSFKELFAGNSELMTAVIAAMAILIPVAMCFGIAFRVFVSNPVLVGQDRYYLENRAGKTDFGRLFSAFGKGYMNVVKVMFFKNLFIFLWSLLLIVPGIVKSFEYFAVDYIMAENPGMDRKRAFELSRGMTQGEKWNIFVLSLSFIGWIFLGLICCGFGIIFVTPYIQATYAELYTALREKALTQNLAYPDELPGIAVTPPPPAPGPWSPPPPAPGPWNPAP